MLKQLSLILCWAITLFQVQRQPLFAGPSADNAIHAAMREQASAWNLGDIQAFMQLSYVNSPETTFVGKTVQHGYGPILERYKKTYPGKDQMGQLTFSDIQVRPLGNQYAAVTGRFHLKRSAASGGDASGIYSLVWEKTGAGWRIILDHTCPDEPPARQAR